MINVGKETAAAPHAPESRYACNPLLPNATITTNATTFPFSIPNPRIKMIKKNRDLTAKASKVDHKNSDSSAP